MTIFENFTNILKFLDELESKQGKATAETVNVRSDVLAAHSLVITWAEQTKQLRRLVAIARLHLADMDDTLDGLDQITFAERNGLYEEYLDGRPWDEVFQSEILKAEAK